MTLIFKTARKISPRYQAVLVEINNVEEISVWINSMTHYGAVSNWSGLIILGLYSYDSRTEVKPGSYLLQSDQTGELLVLSEDQYEKRFFVEE